jgi:hypothetical protein
VAARFVVAHLCPRPRARGIEIALPDGLPAHNVVAAHDAVLRALFAGEIAPDEAEAVTRVLDARVRALNAWRQESAMMRDRPGFPVLPARAGTAQENMAAEAEDEADPAPGPSTRASGAAQGTCQGGGSVASPSPACIPPANSGQPAPDADSPPAGPGVSNRRAEPDDDLHSACIPQDTDAMTPERHEAALALLAALTAHRPPFAAPFAAAEDSA